MKGTVNPFEPWRPVEGHIPPPLHASRPWRPPAPPPARAALEALPAVEPVHPPRNRPPERPKQPQGQGGQLSPTRTPISQRPISQLWLFAVLCVFACIGLDSIGWYRGTHLPRLIVLGISVGLFAARVFSHRRSWYTRLRGMTIALAIAGVALWFVPTIHGVSLWSAYRQVEKLHSLPAGSIAEFQRGAAARQTLVEEFPSFAADVSAAEQAWLRRTVDEAIEKADRHSKNNPEEALDQLHQLDKNLSEMKHYAAVKKDLESARRRALQAWRKVAQR